MTDVIVTFVDVLATALYIAMIGRVIMSWINVGSSNPLYPIAQIIFQVTEPVLAPLRRVLPRFGMLDFSPMVALLLIFFIRSVARGLT